MTISYDNFIIFAQFRIRREITLRGFHVRGSTGVPIPRLIWLSKTEGVNRILNIIWTGCIHIKGNLWFGPKNSSLWDIIVRPIPIVGGVRTWWDVPLSRPLLPKYPLLLPWCLLPAATGPTTSPVVLATIVVQLFFFPRPRELLGAEGRLCPLFME